MLGMSRYDRPFQVSEAMSGSALVRSGYIKLGHVNSG